MIAAGSQYRWSNSYVHFNNVGAGYLALLQVVSQLFVFLLIYNPYFIQVYRIRKILLILQGSFVHIGWVKLNHAVVETWIVCDDKRLRHRFGGGEQKSRDL